MNYDVNSAIISQPLWQKSIDAFAKLYGKSASTDEDYLRVSSIYSKLGGEFSEDFTKDVSEKFPLQEGILDNVKILLNKLFSNPILVGVAMYFLVKLYNRQNS